MRRAIQLQEQVNTYREERRDRASSRAALLKNPPSMVRRPPVLSWSLGTGCVSRATEPTADAPFLCQPATPKAADNEADAAPRPAPNETAASTAESVETAKPTAAASSSSPKATPVLVPKSFDS